MQAAHASWRHMSCKVTHLRAGRQMKAEERSCWSILSLTRFLLALEEIIQEFIWVDYCDIVTTPHQKDNNQCQTRVWAGIHLLTTMQLVTTDIIYSHVSQYVHIIVCVIYIYICIITIHPSIQIPLLWHLLTHCADVSMLCCICSTERFT